MTSLRSRAAQVVAGLALAVGLQPLPAIAASGMRILDQRKQVPAKVEWTRELFVQTGCPLRCVVRSGGALSVTLLAERAYLALQADRRDDLHREDVLVSAEQKDGHFDRDVATTLPGSYWFVIGNLSDSDQQISIQCTAPRSPTHHRSRRAAARVRRHGAHPATGPHAAG